VTPVQPVEISNNPTIPPRIASDIRLRRLGVRKTKPTPGNKVNARVPRALDALRRMLAIIVEFVRKTLALGLATVFNATFTVLMSGSIAGLGDAVHVAFWGKPLQVNVTGFRVDVFCCRVSE
jgi:hypothetical protein